MKLTTTFIIGMVASAVLTGCQTSRSRETRELVTERQECILKSFRHLPEVVDTLTVVVDVPVKGPQRMIDSITVFLNQALYAFFDDGETCHLPYGQVFTKDLRTIASHYREAYAPFFKADGEEWHEFASDCLEIGLAAQTDAYVTYQIDHIFYGEGLEVARDWVTFVKSDGHRLKEVISGADMLRFYRDCPEYRNEDIWRNVLFHSPDPADLHEVDGTTGLLPGSVAHQYVYADGIFEDVEYPMEVIGKYLSREAKEVWSKIGLQ